MQWSPPGTCGGETVKRTPVLVDVHGTPLRESLGYTGGGSVSADRWLTGCPRRKAWMPRCCLRCASAMRGLMIWSVIMVLQQMRWRCTRIILSDTCFLSAIVQTGAILVCVRAQRRVLWMRLKLHGQNIAMVFLAKWMPRGSVLLQSSSVKAWAFTPLMVKFFSSLSGTLKPRRFSVPDSRLSVRNGWTRRGMPAETASFAQEWKRTGMEKPSPIMSVMMTGRWLVGNAGPVFLVFCRPDDPRCYIFSSRLRTDRRAVPISFTV